MLPLWTTSHNILRLIVQAVKFGGASLNCFFQSTLTNSTGLTAVIRFRWQS